MIPEEVVKVQNEIHLAHLGTRNNKLMGREIFSWLVSFNAPADELTVYVSEKLSGQTLANIADNKQVAATVVNPLTHMSFQLKGKYVKHHRCSDAEHVQIKAAINRMYDEYFKLFGYPPEIADTFAYKPFIGITMHAENIFIQTPGPNAGKPLSL